MGLTLQERKSVTRETRRKYRRVARGEKTKILDEFTGITEYNRKYALQLLKGTVKARRHSSSAASPRGHPRVYDPAMLTVLKRLWAVFGFMCGKRLAAALRANLALLDKFCELREVKPRTRKLLLRISPATIDRLLAADRKRLRLKGRSHTRSGSLRRDQIQSRAAWARLIKKVYDADPLICSRCHSPMKVIAVIIGPRSGHRTDPAQVLKILRHLIKKGTPPPGLDPTCLH